MTGLVAAVTGARGAECVDGALEALLADDGAAVDTTACTDATLAGAPELEPGDAATLTPEPEEVLALTATAVGAEPAFVPVDTAPLAPSTLTLAPDDTVDPEPA